MMAQLEETVHYAIAFNLEVIISALSHEYRVYLHYVNDMKKQIHAVDQNDNVHYIKMNEIKHIEVLD